MTTPLLLPALAAGCSSARTDTFDITVRNGTSQPLTLSLGKDGPPYEVAWATPEDLAIETPRRREEWSKSPGGMQVLAPGRVAEVRGLTGRFEPAARGYLRAYAGDLNISQMLAKGAGSPDRVDVQLVPGPNDITIVSEGGQLKAVAGSATPPPSAGP